MFICMPQSYNNTILSIRNTRAVVIQKKLQLQWSLKHNYCADGGEGSGSQSPSSIKHSSVLYCTSTHMLNDLMTGTLFLYVLYGKTQKNANVTSWCNTEVISSSLIMSLVLALGVTKLMICYNILHNVCLFCWTPEIFLITWVRCKRSIITLCRIECTGVSLHYIFMKR